MRAEPAPGMLARFEAQQRAFALERWPDAAVRLGRIDRLRRLLQEHEGRLAGAISADFGNRSRH
jgi:coniferyl-aldehyde dehydrogenase